MHAHVKTRVQIVEEATKMHGLFRLKVQPHQDIVSRTIFRNLQLIIVDSTCTILWERIDDNLYGFVN